MTLVKKSGQGYIKDTVIYKGETIKIASRYYSKIGRAKKRAEAISEGSNQNNIDKLKRLIAEALHNA